MQTGERGGLPVQIIGALRSRRGPNYVAYAFVCFVSTITCRLFKLTLSEKAQVTLELNVILSDLVLRFLAGVRPCWGMGGKGAEKNLFHRGLNPLSGALAVYSADVDSSYN